MRSSASAAGPAGIFTALELLRNGSKDKILLIEKGNYDEAEVAAQSSKKWSIAAAVASAIVCAIYVLVVVIAVIVAEL